MAVQASIGAMKTNNALSRTALLSALLCAGAAQAQYPTRAIKVFIPIPPGGAPDIVARVVADRLSPLLGQPIVAETRAGSSGNIATETVAHSAPDGYSILMAYDAMIVFNPTRSKTWCRCPRWRSRAACSWWRTRPCR